MTSAHPGPGGDGGMKWEGERGPGPLTNNPTLLRGGDVSTVIGMLARILWMVSFCSFVTLLELLSLTSVSLDKMCNKT